MRMHNGTQKHCLCYMQLAFDARLRVLLLQQKEISLLLPGEEEPLLIHVDTVHHVYLGTSLDPEGPVNPMPLTTGLPCSPP